VYRPGSQAIKEIKEEFGEDIVLEGDVLNREQLGAIVFANRDSMSVSQQFFSGSIYIYS
jgi:dephospho-CoA kinase